MPGRETSRLLLQAGARRRPVAKMFADCLRPPARLRRYVTDQAAPFRSRDCRAIAAIQRYNAVIGVEVGDGTQQQGFAGTRGSLDSNTLPCRQGQRCRFEDTRAKITNVQYQSAGLKTNRFWCRLSPRVVLSTPCLHGDRFQLTDNQPQAAAGPVAAFRLWISRRHRGVHGERPRSRQPHPVRFGDFRRLGSKEGTDIHSRGSSQC